MSAQPEERRRPPLPAPERLRNMAGQLREITPVQATQPLSRFLTERARGTLADCLDELARLRADPAGARERRLQDQADEYAVLATSRRVPLAAVGGLITRADEAGAEAVSVDAIRQALARTEADA